MADSSPVILDTNPYCIPGADVYYDGLCKGFYAAETQHATPGAANHTGWQDHKMPDSR